MLWMRLLVWCNVLSSPSLFFLTLDLQRAYIHIIIVCLKYRLSVVITFNIIQSFIFFKEKNALLAVCISTRNVVLCFILILKYFSCFILSFRMNVMIIMFVCVPALLTLMYCLNLFSMHMTLWNSFIKWLRLK